jgi:hypothetical protein
MGCSSSKNDVVNKVEELPHFKPPAESVEMPTPPQSPFVTIVTNPVTSKDEVAESKSCEETEIEIDINKPGQQKEEIPSAETKTSKRTPTPPLSVETKPEPSNVGSEASISQAPRPTAGSSSEQHRKAPSRKKNNRGYIDFQSFLDLESVVELLKDFPYLLDDQILEVYEVMDEDEDGLVTAKQAEDIVFVIRGREQLHSADTVKSATSVTEVHSNHNASPSAASTSNVSVHSASSSPTKKTLIRGTSSMAIEKGIILNDYVAETVISPASPPPQVKRGFLIASSSDSPLSSPSRPTSSSHSAFTSRTPSMGGKSRFHVLDQGILYHLDSNVTSGPVALDKHGVSLRGHTVVYSEPDSNLILLSTKALSDEEEDEVITLSIKNEPDRADWVQAINEHIAYIAEQERLVRRQIMF